MKRMALDKPVELEKIFKRIKDLKERDEPTSNLLPLQLLVNLVRVEGHKRDPNLALRELNSHLLHNQEDRKNLGAYIKALLNSCSFKSSLIDSGILVNADFFHELKKRVSFKLLPSQSSPESLEHILGNVFYFQSDIDWLQRLSLEELEILFDLVEARPLRHGEEKSPAFSEILFSIDVLSMRICGRALESEVLKMVPRCATLENPFISLQREVAEFVDQVEKLQLQPEEDDPRYKHILVLIEQCQDFIKEAYKNTERFGITLRVNQNLLRINQQLDRLELLLSIITGRGEVCEKRDTITFILKLISLNCEKNDVRSLVSEATRVLAFEITQFTGKTGEKYITSTISEYGKMLLTAMGGGLIVGFLCVFKLFFSEVDASPFGHMVLYGLNYSVGFIIIYLLHFTLATKQPAMTASTLAQELSKDMPKKEKYKTFAELFSRLFRSQFIAFFGNVALSFPVALTLVWLIHEATGTNIAANKSDYMLNDLNPFGSLAIFHAAIAGVYLFLSGIIAGNFNNRSKHYQTPERIRRHPFLINIVGAKRAEKLANFYDRNGAGISSNFWFGILLGGTDSIGDFFGLPLDIRHITFSAGNLALGLFGANFQVSKSYLALLAAGVIIIGLVNFTVSFSMTLFLALRSRGIPFKDIADISGEIFRKFLRNPFEFFFPPIKSQGETEEFKNR